jgi:RNA polymerase sigma factor (sigma-70 family)
LPPENHEAHDHQDSRRLRQLATIMESDPASPEANRLITELIVGWRRYYDPRLALKAGRQIADAVVSMVEFRLMRLLRRKQHFDDPWRSVVWAMVRHELAGERRRLARRADKETSVGAVFGEDAAAQEPSDSVAEAISDSPERDFERLRRARAKLSADDQELLRLLFDEELSRDEVAARLGVKPKTLNVRYFRAIGRLRKAWDEDPGPGV